MKRQTIFGISEYTDKIDWKGKHEMLVIPDDLVNEAEVLLLCTKIGEPRRPPPAGDSDVETVCRCGERLLKRKSAPSHAIALCQTCFYEGMHD